MQTCGVCEQHYDPNAGTDYEIRQNPLWVLRHHPAPAPLTGWLLLDARRHIGGPLESTPEEASGWGAAVQEASRLVQQVTGCDRVYAIAIGEGARHLHMHLIPRFGSEPASEAWKLTYLYRAVTAGSRPAVAPEAMARFVERARQAHLTSAP